MQVVCGRMCLSINRLRGYCLPTLGQQWVQGNKLNAKNEIRVATVFRQAPQAFLDMILIHELAHLKVAEHNRAFYKLCLHMSPDYHQLELDARLYLTYRDCVGELY